MYARRSFPLLPSAVILAAGLTALAHATPPPLPWIARDIGVSTVPGVVDVDVRGLWTLRAVHDDGFLSADAFFFVSQPLSGDGSVLALLMGQEGGNPDAGRASIGMIERLAVRTRAVHLGMSSGHALTFSYRSDELKSMVQEGDRRYGPRQFPIWLRLQREGDRFTPFTSADGFGWTQLRPPVTLFRFPKDALAGLSVASGWGGPVTGVFSSPVVAPGMLSPIVQVCAGDSTVLLTWPPVSGAIGYTVRRSAPNTPGFAADQLTPQPIKETSFTDTDLRNGTVLRYLVSAVFDQGAQPVEGWPTAVVATPLSLPAGLFGCDLNLETSRFRGAIQPDPATGNFRISGGGSQIGESEDHGFYASRLVTGDFQITARMLDKPTRTSPGAKAGLMVRETLDGPSRMAFLAGAASEGVACQYRKVTEGVASPFDPVIRDTSFKPPLFLRLVRRGGTISSFLSEDGVSYRPAGDPISFAPPLAQSVYVGYAITSQNVEAIATNTFRDLTIVPPPPP
jgi:hypothetical protein